MSFPAIAEIDAYWEALRGPRVMPRRDEVDPRGLDGALPHAFLLERIAPGVGRLRLAGMHLNELLGMEVRGMPLSALMLPEARAALADILEDVTERPAVAVLSLTAERGLGRPALTARAILAPLLMDDGAGRRILGGLEAIGGIGRAPRRFSIESVFMRTLEATPKAAPVPRCEPVTPKSPVTGFAEPPAAFVPRPPKENGPDNRRPALYLVDRD